MINGARLVIPPCPAGHASAKVKLVCEDLQVRGHLALFNRLGAHAFRLPVTSSPFWSGLFCRPSFESSDMCKTLHDISPRLRCSMEASILFPRTTVMWSQCAAGAKVKTVLPATSLRSYRHRILVHASCLPGVAHRVPNSASTGPSRQTSRSGTQRRRAALVSSTCQCW